MTYDAFISYSHRADGDLAPALRDGLQRLAKPLTRRRAMSVFLDNASLELTSELGASLTARLRDSKWLVLLLSEESGQSPWVAKELGTWTDEKSKHEIALVLTSGEIVWDEAAKDFDFERSTAVSEGMRGVYAGQDTEPLYLDLRWAKQHLDADGRLDLDNAQFRNAVATLAAPIHGIPKDELEGEDIRLHRRARRLRRLAISGLAMLTVAALIASIVAFQQRSTAVTQRDRAEVAEADAVEQRDEAIRNEIKALASQGVAVMPTEPGLGLALAAEADTRLSGTETRDALYQTLTAMHTGEQLVMLAGGSRAPSSVVHSPDGARIATIDDFETAHIWNAVTGKRERELDTADDVVFNHDGTLIATTWDGEVRVWDSATGERQYSVSGTRPAFDLDGTHIFTLDVQDNTAQVWDATTGQAVRSVQGPVGRVQAFNDIGTRVLSIGRDADLSIELVAVWDVVTGQLVHSSTFPAGERVGGYAAFSSDGTHVATLQGSDAAPLERRTARVWDLTSDPAVSTSFSGHDDAVYAVAFSPDGTRIATASADRTARVWGIDSGERLTFSGHLDQVSDVAFNQDGTRLVTASWDKTARVWDAQDGAQLVTLDGDADRVSDGDADPVYDVAFSADGTLIATASHDGTGRMWDSASGTELPFRLEGHTGAVTGISFDPDGTRVATASDDATARVWDATTGEEQLVLAGHIGPVTDVVFDSGGTRIATASVDGTARIWDTTTGVEQLTIESFQMNAVAFNHDGTLLATASVDGTARVWDATTGEEQLTLTGHSGDVSAGHAGNVNDVAFNHDGTLVATASLDNTARVWDAATGRHLFTLAHIAGVEGVAFNHDGTHIATASSDLSARMWDAATGTEVVRFTGHTWEVLGVAFNHDGTRLATAAEDGTARIWDLDISREHMCELAAPLVTKQRVTESLGGSEPTACTNLSD